MDAKTKEILTAHGSMVNTRNRSVIKIERVLREYGNDSESVAEYLEAILDAENQNYLKMSNQEIINDFELWRRYNSDDAIGSGIAS